jgi:hypothetical protein
LIDLEPIGEVPYSQLVDMLAPYLGKIDPDLIIVGNQLQLGPADPPFLLVLNRKEKRIGTIEILNSIETFPGQILTHASWVKQNSYIIANLNKNEFDPEFPPFVIGLTSSYPGWQNLLSYIKLDIRLFKYSAMTCQGSPVLIFEPLFKPVIAEIKQETPSTPVEKVETIEEPVQLIREEVHPLPPPELPKKERTPSAPPVFHFEGFYEAGLTGLTEEEVRYFSN